jgi:hypothetical protein
MIDFTTATPLQVAVDSLERRSPLGLALSSAEIERLPQELKDQSFFSATVENERVLAEMQAKILRRLKLERDTLEDGGPGTLMDRSGFIEDMQAVLDAEGYKPEPGKEGGIQDVSSDRRLGLIWDMQLAMAQGYAKWVSGMDPDILQAVPAQELLRIEDRVEKRNWLAVWKAAGGKTFKGEVMDPVTGEMVETMRMIALKTDPIWVTISRFKKPWPPFEWGSGMGLKNVRRREAEKLGVIGRDDVMEPLKLDFSEGVEASVQGLPDASLERLRSTHGDRVKINRPAATITWKGTPPRTSGRVASAGEAMQARSRELARSLQDAGEDRPQLVAELTAVATGRLLLATVPLSAELPRGVDTIRAPDGESQWVFRKDLVNFAELMRSTPEERARWQGLAAAGEKSALVIIRGPQGERVELRVPKSAAAVWAAARLKDYRLALGDGWTATVDGREVKP